MRRSKEDKAETHRVIVEQAARLFRERGIEQTSVADVMQAAKLTHGGFYRHFQSKDDLVAAAIETAVAEVLDELERAPPKDAPRAVLNRYTSMYLSEGHVNNPEFGCPIAALAAEAGRIGGRVAVVTAESIKCVIGSIAAHLPGAKQAARERSAVMFATLVGAVVIARAAENSEIGKEVLSACRKQFDI